MQPTDPAHDLAQFIRIKQAREDAALTRKVISSTGELRTIVQQLPWLAHHDGYLAQLIRNAQDTAGLLEDTIPPEATEPPTDPFEKQMS